MRDCEQFRFNLKEPMMIKRGVCALLLILLAAALIQAQNPPVPPKPAPELARLKYLEGTWTTSATMQPGPMGPGGKFTGTEHNEMGLGGFFVVGHSTFNSTGMSGTGVSYFGYDANKKVYTYDEFNSMGEADH